MDISLSHSSEGILLQPESIHGMLWLQTHFEEIYWEAIANHQVTISLDCVSELSKDAESAGLSVNLITVRSSINS